MENLSRWDKREKVGWDGNQINEVGKEQNETKSTLVRELVRGEDEAFSVVGHAKQKSYDTCEVTSPLKPKKEKVKEGGSEEMVISPNKEKKTSGKGNWKRVAREVGKTQNAEKKSQKLLVGKKRDAECEGLEETDGLVRKRLCEIWSTDNAHKDDISAVAAMQYRREQ